MLLYPFRYLWWLIRRIRAAVGKPPEYVLFVLEAELPALPDPPRPFWQRFTGPPRLSLKELGERFDAIAGDQRIKGVVLHLRPAPMPMAALQDLRELVARLRKAHKRVVAWAPFYTTGTYYIACACDEILLLPSGSVQPLGFSDTRVFLKDGLARAGLSADFVQVSPYKSAADPLTKSEMSPELREQVTWLLESNHAELVDAIMASRLLDADGARRLIDGSPYGDDAALDRHVVDGVVAEEDLPHHLSAGVGTWERARAKLAAPPPRLRLGRYVAVMRIEGVIVDGRSGRLPFKPPIGLPLLGDERAGDLTVVQAARQIAADKRAAAAVLYVNSRGGSSTASEAMRQALNAIAARKPLVVVMGPVAASGGYWVSTPGSWIVARPGTLTGSIGVLSGKIVTGGVFSRLTLNRETVAFGEHATLENDERAFSEAERAIVRGEVDRIYRIFLDHVSRARKMPVDQVDGIAAGRVWTGRQALERRLVDEMGGLGAGVGKARSLAGLPADAPAREIHPPKRALAPAAAPASSAAWLGYLLEGVTLLNRAPALAVMEWWPSDAD